MSLDDEAYSFAPVPPSIDPREAAAMPTVFLTAHLALRTVAGVAPGTDVLCHTATGGVGLAAQQVVRMSNARMLATAGSADKRCLVRGNGVHTVCSSRSVAFVADTTVAGGRPACVLNTLTGNGACMMPRCIRQNHDSATGFVAASLSLLITGGTFVELSKRDIWSPQRVAQERPDVAYQLLALDFMPPPVVRASMQTLAADLAQGRYTPLSMVDYPLSATHQALRSMSRAKHIGKLVVDLDPGVPCSGCHLLTGGSGGLATHIVRALAQHGASDIVLASRYGGCCGCIRTIILFGPGAAAARRCTMCSCTHAEHQ